jgi:hypothetical protein
MDISPPIVAAIISAATAVFVSLSADRIRLWLTKPSLEVEYSHDVGGYRVSNSDSRIYLRVRIRNKSRHVARSCQAYLVGIESNGRQILYDTPTLVWPHRGHGGINIIKSIDQFLNVAYSVKETPTHLKFAASFRTSHMIAFEENPGNCRVRVALVTENGDRKDFGMDLIWGGSWDKLDAIPFSTAWRPRPSMR